MTQSGSSNSTGANNTGVNARRTNKSEQAFRTISEVAEELDLPQHVLRFWETKFNQISPMKRGGGRRYYRPEDVELLRTIKALLHFDGYTIKGVQKLLSSVGVKNLPSSAKMVSDSAPAEPETRAGRTDARAMANLAVPENPVDLSELAVLVSELEQIRDHLKKSVS